MSFAIADTPRRMLLMQSAPALFVLLWSTGFIGAKYGLPYAGPFTFLAVRLAVAAALLGSIALLSRAPWPRNPAEIGHIAVAGLLVHGVYLGGVFSAIHLGVPAGVSALIVGTQPLLTAVVVRPLLGEQVSPRQWLGLALGFVGVALVVSRTFDIAGTGFAAFAWCVAGLFGITGGTIYQKRFCAGLDLRSGTTIQYAVVCVVMWGMSGLFETGRIEWTGEFLFALGWLCLVLSLGAVTLLYILIRHGAAARVASLFYLVPPTTALMAYFMFGETLGLLALIGLGVTALGVALVNR